MKALDERTRELIAIGVSIGAHCQPCLDFHLGKARDLNVGDDEIEEAVEVGLMVERGASAAMRKYVGVALGQVDSQGGGCCSGGNSGCCS